MPVVLRRAGECSLVPEVEVFPHLSHRPTEFTARVLLYTAHCCTVTTLLQVTALDGTLTAAVTQDRLLSVTHHQPRPTITLV